MSVCLFSCVFREGRFWEVQRDVWEGHRCWQREPGRLQTDCKVSSARSGCLLLFIFDLTWENLHTTHTTQNKFCHRIYLIWMDNHMPPSSTDEGNCLKKQNQKQNTTRWQYCFVIPELDAVMMTQKASNSFPILFKILCSSGIYFIEVKHFRILNYLLLSCL